ncbi:hypothetical protein ABZ612_40875 [Streptomyces avermitilis]|uniref:hypothetical protein n=1 Tax=Streptomyces avermitilis TaxID=33903 RepID=UPI0033E644FC
MAREQQATARALQKLVHKTLPQIHQAAGRIADLHAGDASVRETLDTVLYRDPPLANFAMTYPPRAGGHRRLPAADRPAGSHRLRRLQQRPRPGIAAPARQPGPPRLGRRPAPLPGQCARLPHRRDALHVLDTLAEMDLDGQRAGLAWRPGPFQRSLVALPVTFPTS